MLRPFVAEEWRLGGAKGEETGLVHNAKLGNGAWEFCLKGPEELPNGVGRPGRRLQPGPACDGKEGPGEDLKRDLKRDLKKEGWAQHPNGRRVPAPHCPGAFALLPALLPLSQPPAIPLSPVQPLPTCHTHPSHPPLPPEGRIKPSAPGLHRPPGRGPVSPCVCVLAVCGVCGQCVPCVSGCGVIRSCVGFHFPAQKTGSRQAS